VPEEQGALVRTIRVIDRISLWSGRAVAWLVLPLIGVMSYEIAVRYLMRPTLWAFDLSYMLYGAMFILGSAYTLYRGSHVRTDFLFEKWSIRTQGAIDSVAYIVFFFPALFVFLVVSGHEAWYAFDIGETSEQTPWRPILWPFKAVVPLTCLLLMIQGLSETIKSVYAARTGIELEHKEKVEV